MSIKLMGVFIILLIPFLSFANSFSYFNFDENIKLTKISNTDYQVEDKNLMLRISNRLIIKSHHFLSPNEISNLAPKIVNQITLFKLSSQSYYLLEFDSIESMLIAHTLLKSHPKIRLVQPDVLQFKKVKPISLSKVEKLNDKFKPKKLKRYINYSDINKLSESNKGKSIKIAIIDDGIDVSVAELQRVNQVFNYDFNSQNQIKTHYFGRHGTQVASTIFSTSKQNMGIAPQAELISIRQFDTWTSTTLLSFYMAQTAGADIINASWNSLFLLEPIKDVVDFMATEGRNGKGISVVFSAGNSGKRIKEFSLESAIDKAIVVGSIDKKNKKLSSSNFGKSVDLYAPGWAVNVIKLRPKSLFGATSRAAAITSGYIALMLSDNPELTLNQITNKLGVH